MLKILIKKQLMEVFKGYFYNAKTNKKRDKSGIIGKFLLFGALMIIVLGGGITAMCIGICTALRDAGMDWLYFALVSLIGILLGTFGSVFSTFSGLYLSKDNDLLLSLPIPLKDIILSRLASVFLMGAFYSVLVTIPMVVVYWAITGVTAANLICGILHIILIALIVLLLSCLLGWVVAKLSQKLKNKSAITVFIAIVCFAAYYFIYFKAQVLIRELVANAAVYGEQIKDSYAAVYVFGSVACGNFLSLLIVGLIVLAALVITWLILRKTFLSIAISSGTRISVQYKAKIAKQRSPFGALLSKEFERFKNSANYMLNCGLGVLLLVACGILVLIKGADAFALLESVFGTNTGFITVFLIAILVLIASMNDMATPSISLEGKSLWLVQSLPVDARSILRAKMLMQLILSGLPMVFAMICSLLVMPGDVLEKLLFCITTILFVIFLAVFDMYFGIRMPNLTWTNEITPIKQSGAVAIALFGGWVIAIIFAGIYLLIGAFIGPVVYLLIWIVMLAVASVILYHWINTKGARTLATL